MSIRRRQKKRLRKNTTRNIRFMYNMYGRYAVSNNLTLKCMLNMYKKKLKILNMQCETNNLITYLSPIYIYYCLADNYEE